MSELGLTNSAILLLTLGEEEAAEVFKHLGPTEAQKIGQMMTRLGTVTKDKIEDVLSRFNTRAEQESTIGHDADGFVRNVLTKALGDGKATFLLDRILQGGDVLRNFSDRLRNDVMMRIATLDGIQPTALRELNDVLAKMLAGTDTVKKSALGGVQSAANILNYLGSAVEGEVLTAVREHDAELAQKIEDKMFVFENLTEVDDRGIQALLREVPSETLIVALKGASAALSEKIFKNMSQRAGDLLRDDLEAKGPVRVSDVEAKQKEILKIVRRMSDEGTIVVGGKGDDQFI
jgi:flagellar motor switch protein FliG